MPKVISMVFMLVSKGSNEIMLNVAPIYLYLYVMTIAIFHKCIVRSVLLLESIFQASCLVRYAPLKVSLTVIEVTILSGSMASTPILVGCPSLPPPMLLT